jgi:hypothetical protein
MFKHGLPIRLMCAAFSAAAVFHPSCPPVTVEIKHYFWHIE